MNTEHRVQIRPILYSSQPIRLQVFFRVGDKYIYIDERLKQPKFATKNDIADFVKKTDFNEKLTNVNRKLTSN